MDWEIYGRMMMNSQYIYDIKESIVSYCNIPPRYTATDSEETTGVSQKSRYSKVFNRVYLE
jgi:hypothetical protein